MTRGANKVPATERHKTQLAICERVRALVKKIGPGSISKVAKAAEVTDATVRNWIHDLHPPSYPKCEAIGARLDRLEKSVDTAPKKG